MNFDDLSRLLTLVVRAMVLWRFYLLIAIFGVAAYVVYQAIPDTPLQNILCFTLPLLGFVLGLWWQFRSRRKKHTWTDDLIF